MTNSEREALSRILGDYAARYLQMQARDLYKILHQSSFSWDRCVCFLSKTETAELSSRPSF